MIVWHELSPTRTVEGFDLIADVGDKLIGLCHRDGGIEIVVDGEIVTAWRPMDEPPKTVAGSDALAAERERCLAPIAEAIVDVQTDMEGADAEQLRDLENVEHGLMLAEGRIRALGDDR